MSHGAATGGAAFSVAGVLGGLCYALVVLAVGGDAGPGVLLLLFGCCSWTTDAGRTWR